MFGRANDAVEQLDALGRAWNRGGHGAAAHGAAQREQRGFQAAPVKGDVDGMVFDIEAGNVVACEFHGVSLVSAIRAAVFVATSIPLFQKE